MAERCSANGLPARRPIRRVAVFGASTRTVTRAADAAGPNDRNLITKMISARLGKRAAVPTAAAGIVRKMTC